MKRLFWKYLDFILTASLLLLTYSSYLLSLKLEYPLDAWLINISAGFISSLVIIFGIDALRHGRAEIKKRKGKDVARKDLCRFANMCISYFLFPLGILSYEDDSLSLDLGQNWSAAINRLTLNKALQQNFNYHVSLLTPQKMKEIRLNFSFISSELRDDINLYSELMPPEVHGELLNLRQAFNQVITIFSLWEPFLFREREDHTTQYKMIGDSIMNYTMKVDDFTRVLGDWK